MKNVQNFCESQLQGLFNHTENFYAVHFHALF